MSAILNSQLIFILFGLAGLYMAVVSLKRNNYMPVITLFLLIMFMVNKQSLLIVFALPFVSLLIADKKMKNRNNKFIILFFGLYLIVFILTNKNLELLTIAHSVKLVGAQFIIVMMLNLCIRTSHDMNTIIKRLNYILFISFVLVGIYQYISGNRIYDFEQMDIEKYYTGDIVYNRLTSLMELHPANSANGILFIICILLPSILSKNYRHIIILTVSVVALILTFTRMAYITFIIVILGALSFSNIKQSVKRFFWMLSIIVVFLFIFKQSLDIGYTGFDSERFRSTSNVYRRVEIYTYLWDNFDKFLTGIGYYHNNTNEYFLNTTTENYFLQQYLHFGIFGIILYLIMFYKFWSNMKYKNEENNYRTIIILMMLAFCINMMAATYSESYFFLIFGLSFAYKNVSENEVAFAQKTEYNPEMSELINYAYN